MRLAALYCLSLLAAAAAQHPSSRQARQNAGFHAERARARATKKGHTQAGNIQARRPRAETSLRDAFVRGVARACC